MKNLITMKTVHCFFLTAAVFALAGCGKEILPSDSNGSNNNNGEGGSSGVSDATTIAVTDEEEDLIANTSFVRTISIVFSDTGGATVSGDVIGIVTVVDNQVTIDNRLSSEKVKYELSGTTSNGFLKIYSNNKQALVLNGLSITNPNGAAINNQGKKRCFVVVNGQNYLADGATYTATPDDEDEKAAFFSEGQLIFSGDGSLTVKASGKAGITSDDYIHFLDAPVVEVSSSAGHAIRGKDAVIVSGGTIDAFTSADMKKAMCSDSLVLLNGGVTTVKVTGGTAYDSEDKDYKAAAGVKADQLFIMNAGTLTATSTGSGGKGISGDGPAYFQGGTVKVTVTGSNYGSSSSKNSTSAKGIKFDGDIYISDGTIEAVASNHEAIESKGKIEIAGGTVYRRHQFGRHDGHHRRQRVRLFHEQRRHGCQRQHVYRRRRGVCGWLRRGRGGLGCQHRGRLPALCERRNPLCHRRIGERRLPEPGLLPGLLLEQEHLVRAHGGRDHVCLQDPLFRRNRPGGLRLFAARPVLRGERERRNIGL